MTMKRRWRMSITLIACTFMFTCFLTWRYKMTHRSTTLVEQTVPSTAPVLKPERNIPIYSSRFPLIDTSKTGVPEKNEPERVNDAPDTTNSGDITTQLINQYLLNYTYHLDRSPWAVAEDWVSPEELYPERAPELGAVLYAMLQMEILAADEELKGSQLKLSIMLEGNQSAIFKPKVASISEVRPKGLPYYEVIDRHNAEIAAFHLSRILELRRVPMATGRVIDLERLLRSSTTTDRLKKTFYHERGNICFYGQCTDCRPQRPVCGDGAMLEGTMVLRLPAKYILEWHTHPWERTYDVDQIDAWHTDDGYCYRDVLPTYDLDIVLDLVDISIFNYIIQNGDRHSFETYKDWPSSRVLMFDNANGFGDPNEDLRSMLAPLYQCCRVRMRTYNQLKFVSRGELGSVLGAVLAQDRLAPVLTEAHLRALDRRVLNVINEAESCIKHHGAETVLNISD